MAYVLYTSEVYIHVHAYTHIQYYIYPRGEHAHSGVKQSVLSTCQSVSQWTQKLKYLLNSRFIPLADSLRGKHVHNHTRGALQCPKLSSRLVPWHKSRLNFNIFRYAP